SCRPRTKGKSGIKGGWNVHESRRSWPGLPAAERLQGYLIHNRTDWFDNFNLSNRNLGIYGQLKHTAYIWTLEPCWRLWVGKVSENLFRVGARCNDNMLRFLSIRICARGRFLFY